MKRLALLFICLLFLAGCAASSGEYYSATPHSERPGGAVVLPETGTIGNYSALKSAVLNIVALAVERDVVRIVGYSGDLDADLQEISQEVTVSDPIGVYGVQSIVFDQTRVLTYQEITVSVQYKKAPAEIRGIITTAGEYDFKDNVNGMLTGFERLRVLHIGEGWSVPENYRRYLYSIWMNSGEYAYGLSDMRISFYPKNTENCVAEISADYLYSPSSLSSGAERTMTKASAVCGENSFETDFAKVEYVYEYLRDNVQYDQNATRVVNETGGWQPKTSLYTAYGALVDGKAAQSGIVIAAHILCRELGLDAAVSTGTSGGDIYSWLTLSIDGQEMCFDVTAQHRGSDIWLLTPEQETETFATWE